MEARDVQAAQICAAAADSMSVVSAFGKACRMSPTFRAVMKESPESMRPVLTSRDVAEQVLVAGEGDRLARDLPAFVAEAVASAVP